MERKVDVGTFRGRHAVQRVHPRFFHACLQSCRAARRKAAGKPCGQRHASPSSDVAAQASRGTDSKDFPASEQGTHGHHPAVPELRPADPSGYYRITHQAKYRGNRYARRHHHSHEVF